MFFASCIDVLCMFSAEKWRTGHSKHHKAHGNMNQNDLARTLMSSSEYDALPTWKQKLYDVFRWPPLFLFIAPIYIFWIDNIYSNPFYFVKYGILLYVLYYIGSWKLVIAFLIAQYITGIWGLGLFHLQHTVNDGYWKRFDENDKLQKDNAELIGSSVLTIPWPLEYFTNGIEYHSVHHVDPGVPGYNTKECYYQLVKKGLLKDTKIRYGQMWKSLWHTKFNEETQLYE